MQKLAWEPAASIKNLRARAAIIANIRRFFEARGVMEVETQLLSHATVTDPYVVGIPANAKFGQSDRVVYLQTSPEYAMKRLLAAGSGPIFQICKAFRQGDIGKLHNPEFTILEWYRLGFDHHALMDEMDELLQEILQVREAQRLSCVELFENYLSINPHFASYAELHACAKQHIDFLAELSDKNACLDLLFTHCIEPHIGQEQPIFIYDFPASQAALAKIRPGNPSVASRFEVYFKGIELANGFHELQDAAEQRKRFEDDLIYRDKNQLPYMPLDENFLAALNHGMPDCAGVALGVDRLVMLALKCHKISDVLSFDFERA